MLSHQFELVGWVTAIIINTLVGALSLYGLHILVSISSHLQLSLDDYFQFTALNILCKKHKKGYISYGKALYIGFKDGPSFMKWAAVPSYILVNSIMVIFQFCTLCLYYEFVCDCLLQLCSNVIDKNAMSLAVFPIFVLIYSINHCKIIATLSIIADILLMAVFCIILYVVTSTGIKPKEHVAFRGARYIPSMMCTTLNALETTGVVSKL